MGIIYQPMIKLKIRERVIIYISVPFAILMGTVLLSIDVLSENNRKQEFYQRLKDRTTTTLKILIEVKEIDINVLQAFDRNTINNLYEEKILIFNEKSELVYSSVDDPRITYPETILRDLRNGKSEIETAEGEYEVMGIGFSHDGKSYYGIAKAYDKFGKKKTAYLRVALVVIFFVSVITIIVISFLLSRQITSPIKMLAAAVEKHTPENLFTRIDLPERNDEIGLLMQKFNELLDRLEAAFAFQKNFIQHISHELKTPLAIMLTNAERSLREEGPQQWKESLEFQRATTMEIAHIINALIDISRIESNKSIATNEQVRVDEIIFECIEEIGYLNAAVNFNCIIDEQITDEQQLSAAGNKRMLKLAFLNLLKNAINYSGREKASIEISQHGDYIKVHLENEGQTLDENDQSRLFIDLFRGKNAQSTKGLGLGLFLTHKIINLHQGAIYYKISEKGTNVFMVQLPLYKN